MYTVDTLFYKVEPVYEPSHLSRWWIDLSGSWHEHAQCLPHIWILARIHFDIILTYFSSFILWPLFTFYKAIRFNCIKLIKLCQDCTKWQFETCTSYNWCDIVWVFVFKKKQVHSFIIVQYVSQCIGKGTENKKDSCWSGTPSCFAALPLPRLPINYLMNFNVRTSDITTTCYDNIIVSVVSFLV